MGYELQGTIKVIMDPQTFPSGFSKREFVVTVPDGRFPQDIKLTCVKEKAVSTMLKLVNYLQWEEIHGHVTIADGEGVFLWIDEASAVHFIERNPIKSQGNIHSGVL